MRQRIRTIQAACVLGLGIMSGCASLLPPSPLAPFFTADSADATLIEALAHEQYTRVEHCQERKSCPQEHYTRALVALFQSRDRALASFQQVQTLAPNSRFAALSTSWIDLLQANSSGLRFLEVQSAGVKVTEGFVWETLERELAEANEHVRHLFLNRAKRVGIVANGPSLPSPDQATLARDKEQGLILKEKDPAAVQVLQKQLQERERMIAERDHRLEVMSSQLDDLKRIELDSRDRRRPVRPLATVTP